MTYFIKETAGLFMMMSFMLCLVPQIIKIVKTKSANDLSPYMIVLSMSGYLFGLIYMFLTGFGLWWFLNYTTGMVTASVLLYFWYIYKNNS